VTRLTAILLQAAKPEDIEVLESKATVKGVERFGFLVSIKEKAPSGFQRMRLLLSSQHEYASQENAHEAAVHLVNAVRTHQEGLH
jgi:hypothetical protein